MLASTVRACTRSMPSGYKALDSRLDGFRAAPASTVIDDRLRTDKPPRYFTKPPRPTQPPTFSGTRSEYRPKCDDAAIMLCGWGAVKAGMTHSVICE